MTHDLDVMIVGGGAMGTAAARALAERGRRTLLLERAVIGHDGGSSAGRTRIFRRSYHHRDYVRLATLALDEWRELEFRSGERLLHTLGGLDAGAGAEACAEAMTADGVPFERVSAAAVEERWPALRFHPDERLVLQQDAGVCLVKETLLAQARLARDAGAELLEATEVSRARATGVGVEIETTAGATYRAPIAVFAAGAWNGPLLRHAGVEVELRPTFEQPAHFRFDRPSPLPTLVDRSDPATPRYAVPDPRDPRALKVGTHLGRVPVEPNAMPDAFDEERLAADVAYARERFAGAEPTGEVDACLYTMTPDEDFVIDRRGKVVVCSPCSGHGFKFAPLVGALVADLVDARPTPLPIERFRSTRASLTPA